jgi:hypothetical protein
MASAPLDVPPATATHTMVEAQLTECTSPIEVVLSDC